MKWISASLLVTFQILSLSGTEGVLQTCKNIKDNYPNAASGVYDMDLERATTTVIEVYCEMGLDNGGFTFLNSRDLQFLTNEDLQAMFTDKTTFLLRLRECNNLQPYILLRQMTQYRNLPLKLGLNEHSGYNPPVNANTLGSPYLYFGFLPISDSANHNTQGLWANGKDFTFSNSDANPNSYFALFSNNEEKEPNNFLPGTEWPLFNQVLDSAKINPSKRGMPVEYFYFMETLFGGAGWYSQTDSRLDKKCIVSAAIGFR